MKGGVVMMTVENARKKDVCVGCASTFRFTFDLEDGVMFGSRFECRAQSERDAWNVLANVLPGAASCVKSVDVIN